MKEVLKEDDKQPIKDKIEKLKKELESLKDDKFDESDPKELETLNNEIKLVKKEIEDLQKQLKESVDKEGEGEISKDKEQKLIDFVKTHKNLDDDDFHAFAEKLGIDPHEAEEVIYRKLNIKLKEDQNEMQAYDATYKKYSEARKKLKAQIASETDEKVKRDLQRKYAKLKDDFYKVWH